MQVSLMGKCPNQHGASLDLSGRGCAWTSIMCSMYLTWIYAPCRFIWIYPGCRIGLGQRKSYKGCRSTIWLHHWHWCCKFVWWLHFDEPIMGNNILLSVFTFIAVSSWNPHLISHDQPHLTFWFMAFRVWPQGQHFKEIGKLMSKLDPMISVQC